MKDNTYKKLNKDFGTLIEKGYIGSLHNCINNGEIRLTRGDIINATIYEVEDTYFASEINEGLKIILPYFLKKIKG